MQQRARREAVARCASAFIFAAFFVGLFMFSWTRGPVHAQTVSNPSPGLIGQVVSGAIAYPTTAATCTSGTVTVTGAGTGNVPIVSPTTQTGNTVSVDAYVSSANTVTIEICAVATTSAQSPTFNVRVYP